MELCDKIETVQEYLNDHHVDGWLLYDNHGSNRFVRQLLGIPHHLVLTRRFFYWIPKKGEPKKILHQIESETLDFLPGKKLLYLSWHDLEDVLHQLLSNSIHRILMEYSHRNANPYVSVVDAGTFEIIREIGIEVLTSADLLQYFTSVLDQRQIASHVEAAAVLQTVIDRVWDLIAERLRREQKITEYEVQKFILSEFTAHNCITEEGPICAVNEHSALPHYMATKTNSTEISRGDFILVDLWCKIDHSYAVYADITKVAIAAPEPLPKHEEVFKVVKQAQLKGVAFVREKVEAGQSIRGADVDDVCRGYISECGYGEYFTHRTGHNIDTSVHGGGAHLDNLETSDYRKMLPGMCFSIEPGIYLPNAFGVRLESNLVIEHDKSVKVTGGLEESIVCLL